jgi:hypothetical protein
MRIQGHYVDGSVDGEAAQALSATFLSSGRGTNFFASPSGLENAARGF